MARALYPKPRLLVIDEGTSSIDLTTESEILASIERARIGTTIFLIAHRTATLKIADQVLALLDGKIMGFGRLDDVKENTKYLGDWLK